MQQHQNVKICLTGGPCAGKTTLQVALTEAFGKYGWRVYRVPEAASILIGGGVNFAEMTEDEAFQFQVNLVRTMLQLEATYDAIAAADARAGHSSVVICDRGLMDASAYMSSEAEWQRLLETVNLTDSSSPWRDSRYDLVLHLRTAADGAPDYYSRANNLARKEDPHHALHLDQAVLSAWTGHPYLVIIGNDVGAGGFEAKLNRACQAALARFGLVDRCDRDSFRRVKLRYDLKDGGSFRIQSLVTPSPIYRVEHWILPSGDPEILQIRLRRRTDTVTCQTLYTLATRRRGTADGGRNGRLETRRNLGEREFAALLEGRTTEKGHMPVVRKQRRTIVWDNIYYQIDQFEDHNAGLVLVEAYIPNGQPTTTITTQPPPFLPEGSMIDVTEDPAYTLSNLSIALIGKEQ